MKDFKLNSVLPALSLAGALAVVLGAFVPPARRSPDAASFGRLPVLNGGRLKPVDTVARASLLMLRGKQTVEAEGRRQEASEWLLDVLARPDRADAAKVFVIEDPDILGLMGRQLSKDKYFSYQDLSPYLDEIGRQSEQAEKLESQSRSRFQSAVVNLKDRLVLYQRLKSSVEPEGTTDFPRELSAYEESLGPGIKAIAAHQGSKKFDRGALQTLDAFFEKYRFLSEAAEFFPVPPRRGEKAEDWTSTGASLLEELRGEGPSPAVRAWAAMMRDYASGPAGAFDADVAAALRAVEDGQPGTAARARFEALFNRVQPFYTGMILYVVVFLLAVCSWLGWARPLGRSAYAVLLVAFAVHTAGLLTRMFLEGRPPVTNLYSSALFVGWTAVLVGVIVERLSRKGLGSAVAAAMGFSTLLIAHHLTGSGDTMEMMRAVLDSNYWLGTHVVTITMGYGGTFLAGALAHVYILRGLLTPSLDRDTARSLTRMTYGVVCFSLFFSFVGTILGGIWADQSWGRFWGWDPKENGALLIVLWNAIILHARWGGFIRERGLMVLAVFGNIVTSLSWFGVNMLGIGLHSYGFMDKAFEVLVAFVIVELGVIALGSLPLADWRSFRDPAARPA